MLNECKLLTNATIEIGIAPILKESNTPLMIGTKRNLGSSQKAAALHQLLSALLMSLPNVIVNAI